MNTTTAGNETYIVRVIGLLPFYVPLPNELIFKPTLIGTKPFYISFSEFIPLRHPDDSHGKSIDDGIGTFLKSQVHLEFQSNFLPDDNQKTEYKKKALSITNRAISAARYVTFNESLVHIHDFETMSLGVLKVTRDGKNTAEGNWQEQQSFGPFGIKIQSVLSEEGIQKFWFIFNELTPINNAWTLILDAKYHNARGDIERAIFDAATALEISIDYLLFKLSYERPDKKPPISEMSNIYSQYDNLMHTATGHSLHERPDLFIELEYIRELRNSIAHEWKPFFHITDLMKSKTRYVDQHLLRNDHLVTEKKEVDEIINNASLIISTTTEWFGFS